MLTPQPVQGPSSELCRTDTLGAGGRESASLPVRGRGGAFEPRLCCYSPRIPGATTTSDEGGETDGTAPLAPDRGPPRSSRL